MTSLSLPDVSIFAWLVLSIFMFFGINYYEKYTLIFFYSYTTSGNKFNTTLSLTLWKASDFYNNSDISFIAYIFLLRTVSVMSTFAHPEGSTSLKYFVYIFLTNQFSLSTNFELSAYLKS